MKDFLDQSETEISELLNEFFKRSQESINSDFESSRRLPDKALTQAEHEPMAMLADAIHRRLIYGAVLWNKDSIDEDLALITAALPAQQIAEMACSSATGGKKLSKILDVISAADGSGNQLRDTIDERVYEELVRVSDDILERIFETVFLNVLERYHLERIASLYEKSRSTFAVRYEVGRRLSQRSTEADKKADQEMADELRSRYGEESINFLNSRLAARGMV